MQEIKADSPENKPKKVVAAAIAVVLVGAWFLYTSWASRISSRIVLMPEIPVWTTYFLIGTLVGAVFAVHAIRSGEEAKSALSSFGGGFCFSFFFSLNVYSVSAYLLPGDIVNYESAYEITVPGPATGKLSRCEAGILINDSNTHRRIELCVNKSEIYEKIHQGMNAVWVTAHANNVGSYIIGYTFFHK